METIDKKIKAISNVFACDDFSLTTPVFDFTKTEIAFVRKFLQRRYPGVMSDFIDAMRNLMSKVQNSSTTKLYYEALMKYNEHGNRWTVLEALYKPGREETSVLMIAPITKQQRENIIEGKGIEHIDPAQMIAGFQKIAGGFSTYSKARLKFNGVQFSIIAEYIVELLEKIKHHLVIYSNAFVMNENNTKLILEIGHKDSQSHMLRIVFDLDTAVPIIDTDEVVETLQVTSVELTPVVETNNETSVVSSDSVE